MFFIYNSLLKTTGNGYNYSIMRKKDKERRISMNISQRLQAILAGLYASLRRFPAALLASTTVAVILIITNHLSGHADQKVLDTLGRVAAVAALGFPLFLCCRLLIERFASVTPLYIGGIYTAAAALLVTYYFTLFPGFKMVPMTRYIAVSIALYLAFIFLPYVYRRGYFELYVIKLFSRFFVTAIYSGILYAGLAALLFAIKTLLSVPVPNELYADTFFLVAGIFAPTFLLAGVPARDQEMEPERYPKLFKILLLYIVMPILTAYTIILYIYFAKIVITLQWPQGLVSHLVLWYSVIVAVVVFFITPKTEENAWAKGFVFWFPKLILPILAIMFVSIGIRIRAYGFTENRYFVVLLGIWSTAVMLYLALVRRRNNIILPISLALIALLGVFGPFHAYRISINSQNQRFVSLLEKYDMLKDTKISTGKTVSDTDKSEFSSILEYFNSNHSLVDVKYLPKDFELKDMEKTFGFAYSYNPQIEGRSEYFSYNRSNPDRPIRLEGYDYLFDLRAYYGVSDQTEDGLKVRYIPEATKLQITLYNQPLYDRNLADFAVMLQDKLGTINQNNTPVEDMTFTDENERVKVKLVFLNVYGYKDKDTGQMNVNSIEYYLLVKVK
jgi:hypothetical protein